MQFVYHTKIGEISSRSNPFLFDGKVGVKTTLLNTTYFNINEILVGDIINIEVQLTYEVKRKETLRLKHEVRVIYMLCRVTSTEFFQCKRNNSH